MADRSCLGQQSALYKKHRAHGSLEWIVNNYITNGMTIACVEEVLGKGEPYHSDFNTNTIEYYGIKADPCGRHLLLYMKDGRVKGIEWVSE